MKLRELQIGDKFYGINDKKRTIYQVAGKCVFSSGHGSSIRVCTNLNTKKGESKSCNLEVIKINENTI